MTRNDESLDGIPDAYETVYVTPQSRNCTAPADPQETMSVYTTCAEHDCIIVQVAARHYAAAKGLGCVLCASDLISGLVGAHECVDPEYCRFCVSVGKFDEPRSAGEGEE